MSRPHELGVAEPFQAARKGKESIMLVLSRKKNESIVINDDITIVVVEIRGDKVRLGVEAPKEVPVHRRERASLRSRLLTTTKVISTNDQLIQSRSVFHSRNHRLSAG